MTTTGLLILHGHILARILWVNLGPNQLLYLDKKQFKQGVSEHIAGVQFSRKLA